MRKKILVVDDEPAIARLVKMTLAAAGFEVHIAYSGFEALEEAEKFRPDVIVLDIMMPGMNGYEVCKRIKSHPGTKHMLVIYLTAYYSAQNSKTGLIAGADECIQKPFDPELLLKKIKLFFPPRD